MLIVIDGQINVARPGADPAACARVIDQRSTVPLRIEKKRDTR
jgi:hypothetical protein